MSTKQLDLLNIGLIVISAILAYLFPLELFIFAFALLGPLHYLTEINWLDKKNYFTNQPKNYWLIISLVASALIVFPKIYFVFAQDIESAVYKAVSSFNGWTNGFLFLTIILSLGFAFFPKKKIWLLLISLGVAGGVLLNSNETYTTIIGLLVPTIIHVYIFTVLFMLYGAIKSKSNQGYIAVAMALVAPLFFVVVDLSEHTYLFTDDMKTIYLENSMHTTPVLFSKFIGISDGTSFFFYETMELRLMMFISFIYLYHYLNWFSKTSVIGWHKNLTTGRTIGIVAIWAILLALFYYDYKLGFAFALFFSFLHVILEFPLNLVSIRGIIFRK